MCRSSVFALTVAFALLSPTVAHAGGPRWYGGSSYFAPAVKGQPIVWSNGKVVYYTDQGSLSSALTQAQANSMVATAAAVWSGVATAAVSITRGGALGEDVNGTNVINGASGITEPADIQPSSTLPVAVVYDADGSVINAIYGQGASANNACQENAVMVSVDNLSTAGNITHAVMLVNGLCAITTTQIANLQYQLIRGFGRVLGLDWSSTNEEIFASNQIPAEALAGWPIMHPVEHLCTGTNGTCMPNSSTLRYDDIAALNRTYPVTAANLSLYPKKILTASATFSITGTITFRRGQGMQGVNVVLRPISSGQPDVQHTVTAVSGARFQGQQGNPVDGSTDAEGNVLNRFGSDDQTLEGYFELTDIPLPPGLKQSDYQLTFEAINPNFDAGSSVGPYVAGQVTPSGTMPTLTIPGVTVGASLTEDVTVEDSADELLSGTSGTETAPASVTGTGEWTGRVCCYGDTGWFQFWAKANREFTVEIGALDESGAATENKLQPVIGLWNGTDPAGTSPVTGTLQPFNGAIVGLTQEGAVSTASSSVRIGIADYRGDGRPDYAYRGRLLYADSVSPGRLPASGGPIIIQGTGFRPGAVVTVNGLNATVTSVTPNEIGAIAPPANGATGTVLLQVQDPQTLGVATIGDGLSYGAQNGDGLTIVSAPSGTIPIGVPTAYVVKALDQDLSPVAGETVTFSVTEGAAQLGCGAATCQVVTAANGVAVINLSPASTSLTQITASLSNGNSVLSEFTGAAASVIYPLTPSLFIAIGSAVTWTPSALVLSNSQPAAGSSVLWQNSGSPTVISLQPASTTGVNGVATGQFAVGPLTSNNPQTFNACVSGASACTSFKVIPVHPETALLEPVSGASQSVAAGSPFAPVVLEATDAVGDPMAGAVVTFHETQMAWTPECVTDCVSPQVLSQQTVEAITNSLGQVTLNAMSAPGASILRVQATVGSSAEYDFELEQQPN